MRFVPVLALPLVLSGCTDSPTVACDEAVDRVRSCFGSDTAEDFAGVCTPEKAEDALGFDCESLDKADDGRDGVLCLTFGIRCEGAEEYDDAEMRFKYGSIGTDVAEFPYWIAQAMPTVCQHLLPNGNTDAFGFIQEPFMDRPLGFSKRNVAGLDMSNINCAFCHTGTVRDHENANQRIYLGAPAHQMDLRAYREFQLDCAEDSRFTAGNLIAAIDDMTDMGSVHKAALYGLVPLLRWQSKDLREKLQPVLDAQNWGPGRVDVFNAGFRVLLFGEDANDHPWISTADYPSIWNQSWREGIGQHWDGSIDEPMERNIGVAVGNGAPPDRVEVENIELINQWMRDLPSPEYPYSIDHSLAQVGAAIYDRECSSCHDVAGARYGEVLSLQEIGTDIHRARSFDQETVDNFNEMSGNGWSFSNWVSTQGYVNSPLDGIWLRAPYLHNGSVPNLRALLEPPGDRPEQFYRGNDVYDRDNLGFVSHVPGNWTRDFFLYDTTAAGNANSGHLYGTTLSDGDKTALLEYLKTL